MLLNMQKKWIMYWITVVLGHCLSLGFHPVARIPALVS